MLWPAVNGPEVTRVFTSETSAEAPVVPPLPVLSVLLDVFGSGWAAVAVAFNATAPAEIFALSLHVAVPISEARLAMVHGRAAQPPPVTLVMVRFVGVS